MVKKINIADAESNEIAQLSAIANGATFSAGVQLQRANEIVAEERKHLEEFPELRYRPVDVKRAWAKVAGQLPVITNKPFDANLSKIIKDFLKISVRAGFSEKEDLAAFLGTTADIITDISTLPACIDARERLIREIGKENRAQKKQKQRLG